MKKALLLTGLLILILVSGCKVEYENCAGLDNESNVICNISCKGECYYIPCGSDDGVHSIKCHKVQDWVE